MEPVVIKLMKHLHTLDEILVESGTVSGCLIETLNS